MEKYNANVEFWIQHDSVKFPEGHEYESRKGHMNIAYNIEIEGREYGIKSIIIFATQQKRTVEVEVLHPDKEDTELVTVDIDILNFEVENPDRFGSISPKEMELTITSIEKDGDKYKAQAKALLKF